MLWEFAKWSEATALGVAIRNSQYAFPIIEYFHLAALAVIGGAVLIVDMRMLGLGLRETPVAQLAKDAHPWLVGSLIVMLVSGVSLYTSEATKCYASPAFWIKMIALVLAMLFTFTVRRKVSLADAAHVSAGAMQVGGARVGGPVVCGRVGRPVDWVRRIGAAR